MDRNVIGFIAKNANSMSLSARRAWIEMRLMKERTINWHVALRKESVDRNQRGPQKCHACRVALRKESVDRNAFTLLPRLSILMSLSARRAWIEICQVCVFCRVALSLSARRAWIEMLWSACLGSMQSVALRKESVDRNATALLVSLALIRRSPQGERG